MLLAALFGFGAGFLGSIPVAGPISALVVSRGVQGRFKAGVFIALGGGLVEALYAFLAFWGFATFLAAHPIIEPISRAAAALVLLGLGVTFVLKKADAPAPPTLRDSKRGSFFLGAWICAINPTLIVTWSGFVTTVYSSGIIDFQGSHALPFALGCATGITGWFIALLSVIRRYRERFSPRVLGRIVNAIGVVLLGLSVWFAFRFVQYFTDDRQPVVAASSPALSLCARRSR